MKVTLWFNKEQEQLLSRNSLKTGQDIKRFILEKLREDTKQSVLIGMLKTITTLLIESRNEQREFFLKLISMIEENSSSKESVSIETEKVEKIAWIVKEMLRLFILNYTQLYQDNVKRAVLHEIEKLWQEVSSNMK